MISEGGELPLTVPSPGPYRRKRTVLRRRRKKLPRTERKRMKGKKKVGISGEGSQERQWGSSTGGRAEGDPPGGSVLELPALPQSPISGSSDEEEEEDDDEGPVMKRTADEEVWAGLWTRGAVRDHVDMAPDPCGARAGARELGWDPGSPVTPRHFSYLNSSLQDEVDPKRQKTENGASA